MNQRSDLKAIASVAQLVAVVLTVAVLFVARDIFIPLALGLLLSFLLSPVVDRLQRVGVPNVLAVIATATLAFLLLAGGFTILGRELSSFVYEFPQYKDELVTKAKSIAGLTSGVGGSFDNLASEVTAAMEGDERTDGTQPSSTPVRDDDSPESSVSKWKQWSETLLSPIKEPPPRDAHDGKTPETPLYTQTVAEELPIATWAATAGSVLGPLATAGLVTVFALFMLIHREDLRDRIIAVISHGNYVTTTEALDEVARRISRYLIAQTVINSSYGFVLTIGLMIIGATMTADGRFPNALLWGVLAACLRFVPYIGPTASAIFPLALAIAVFPGYSVFLAVLALIVVMELVSNNVIEPWLYGTSTGISTVAVIIAAVFWGWLWGPVGLLLSTPLTVCLVVLGRHVPRFRILTTLLGEDVQVKPALRFYQRLLAGDRFRAKELLVDYVDQEGVDAACDEVLIPALKRVRADLDAEELPEESYASLTQAIDEIVSTTNWLGDEAPQLVEGQESDPALPLVVGCLSHHSSERVVLDVIQAVSGGHWRMEVLDQDAMPVEVGKTIVDREPAVAVIMVLPTGGFAQARFLCKTIREQGYKGPVIIACMGKFKHFDRLFVGLRKAGATSMTTSFKQTRSKISSFTGRRERAEKLAPKPPSPSDEAVVGAISISQALP